MKRQLKKFWQAITILIAASVWATAQTNMPVQQPGSMPPPGAVNYVEGQVSLDGQALSPRSVGSTVLAPNQALDTAQGHAEVLLTPGAFLRIGDNSEVRLISNGLTDAKFAVTRGSAMVEVAQFVKGTRMNVVMNDVTTQIEQNGLYDFDANQGSVKVLDGKAKVLETSRETTLKKGDEVLLASDKPLKKHDFDQKAAQSDPLYVWSKVRSEDEAQSNIHEATIVNNYGGWYGPGWYWDPFWSSYAFLPAYGFLGSPFGWGFYSPRFVYAAPYYWHRPGGFAYRGGHYVGPAYHSAAGVHAMGGGFHGGGFHGGGFHGGGGHGGGGRR